MPDFSSVVKSPAGELKLDPNFLKYAIDPSPSVTAIELVSHNGDHRDRSMCLAAGAGEAAAYQCGDLMVAHSMPGYRTKGRDRALTLVYNSSQAEPRPAVAVEVTNSSGMTPPDEIAAELVIDGDTVASATYTQWTGATKQIVLAFDGSSLSSGLYPFTLDVHNVYTSGPETASISDTLVVVNRSASEFGRGWSLAGIEQLVTGQGVDDILWIGGDGSAKRYRKLAASTWRAAAGGYRDTLTLSGSTYTRTLRHGVKVEFNSSGQHVRTINRAGDTTRVTWSGTPSRLQSIRVPPDTAINGNTYDLDWDGNDKLDKITDPAGRMLNATVASGELTRLTDPDDEYVKFDYDAQGRMDERTNRRSYKTTYAYDNALRLTEAVIPLDVTAGDTATTTYSAWDEFGLAIGTGNTNASATATTLVYTSIDGPRGGGVTDVSKFWVDRWGAPTKIRDPLNNDTEITRSTDGLPTEVEYPDGRIVTMTWDSRANLTAQRDSSSANGRPTAVTTWTYGDSSVPDSPTAIEAPDGEETEIAYTSAGLPDTVTAPNGHLTVFQYGVGKVKQGLITKVIEDDVSIINTSTWADVDQDLETAFAYDSLGNVESDTSALGNVRTFVRDSAQRVVMMIDAVSDTVEYVYDPLNRIEEFKQHAEAGVLTTSYTYDESFLTEIEDPRGVTRSYTYDAGGRLTKETDWQDKYDEHAYDEAGLRIWSVTRNLRSSSDTIRMRYDAAGRLLAKRWPEVQDSVRAPKDSVKYMYDSMGRITWARNYASPAFTITRTWYDNGLLKSEQREESVSGSNEATVSYVYTAGGKDSIKVIGAGATTEQPDSVWYRYDANQELDRIVVAWGYGSSVVDSVRFAWDELGRRKTLTYSDRSDSHADSVLTVGFSYDEDGRVRRICSEHQGGLSSAGYDIFRIRVGMDYNDDGTMSHRDQYIGDLHDDDVCEESNDHVNQNVHDYAYDKRKQMVKDSIAGLKVIDFVYDSSANLVKKRTTYPSDTVKTEEFRIVAESNRLATWIPDSATFYADTANAYRVSYLYHDDGSRGLEWPSPTFWWPDWRKYYLDGLGRLALIARYSDNYIYDKVNGAYQRAGLYITMVTDTVPSCKYDPLGRLIDPCGSSPDRFTYDGDNIVRTGEDEDEYAWTFIHGPGIDDPIMAHRKQSASDHLYIYYVTDGRGRQLAVGDSVGYDYANPDETDPTGAGGNAEEYLSNGGKYAGGMHDSFGFQPERHPATEAPDLSFFRNRWFDQKTGRWTQEDPLGLAAGTNLYNYVGNNPTAYTDPFGLRPCDPPDSPECRDSNILILAVSASFALFPLNIGGNLEAGIAFNREGEGVLFAKTGPSFGSGANIGFELTGQRGRLKDVTATSAQARRAVEIESGAMGLSVNLSMLDAGIAGGGLAIGGNVGAGGGTVANLTALGLQSRPFKIGAADASLFCAPGLDCGQR